MQYNKAETTRDKWGKSYHEVLAELLKERGVTKYAVFGAHDQGLELPSGLQTWFCLVLTPDDKLWGYFLDWDSDNINPDGEKGYHKLREPRERSAESFKSDIDYIHARKQMGLPLTEEQERTLLKGEQEHHKG